MKTYHKLN